VTGITAKRGELFYNGIEMKIVKKTDWDEIMQTHRQLSHVVFWTDFLPMVARDVVRHAVHAEGLETWLSKYGGTDDAPSRATRAYAADLLGDTDEADVLNAMMILEIDRVRRMAA